MLTDLAWLLRGDEEQNPIREYKREYVYLTGWSQSGSYLFRYLNSFAYRPEVARGACVFNGYLPEEESVPLVFRSTSMKP